MIFNVPPTLAQFEYRLNSGTFVDGVSTVVFDPLHGNVTDYKILIWGNKDDPGDTIGTVIWFRELSFLNAFDINIPVGYHGYYTVFIFRKNGNLSVIHPM
jgi:hypothetical protein